MARNKRGGKKSSGEGKGKKRLVKSLCVLASVRDRVWLSEFHWASNQRPAGLQEQFFFFFFCVRPFSSASVKYVGAVDCWLRDPPDRTLRWDPAVLIKQLGSRAESQTVDPFRFNTVQVPDWKEDGWILKNRGSSGGFSQKSEILCSTRYSSDSAQQLMSWVTSQYSCGGIEFSCLLPECFKLRCDTGGWQTWWRQQSDTSGSVVFKGSCETEKPLCGWRFIVWAQLPVFDSSPWPPAVKQLAASSHLDHEATSEQKINTRQCRSESLCKPTNADVTFVMTELFPVCQRDAGWIEKFK